MSKALDIGVIGALAGMTHTQAKDLPPPTQEFFDSLWDGGTSVIWKEERPIAVVVILPATPTAGEEAMRRLSNYFMRTAPPAKAAKKRQPRRGRRR